MTAYRFVAIGDLHLIAGPKNADRLAALDYVIAAAPKAGPVDAWLWPGDLTHVGMTIELRNLLVERTTAMAAIAPVVVVPGNHDPQGDLDFLGRLKTVWPVYVSRKPEVVDVAIKSAVHAGLGKDAALALFCLPYPSKAMLVAAGTPHDEIGKAVDAAMDVIFMQAGMTLDSARKAGRLTGAIGHVSIAGSVSSVGQPQIGTELEITEQHLGRLGDCFQIFNHIHKHQRVGGAVYPGSVCRMDYGELETKGYVVVECDYPSGVGPGGAFVGWRHTETFVEIPVAPMMHVEVTVDRDHVTFTSGLSDDYSGADVRVRASYQQAERDLVWQKIKDLPKLFVGARRVDVEPIAIQQRTLRAPEVVEATTLTDKLRAYAKVSGVTWSEQIERCVDRVQRSDDGDAVVKEVTERLEPLADLNLVGDVA